MKRPGGAEVEATFLFADVRGSTALAESVGAEEFRGLMARFYAEAAAAVDVRNGIVDKFAGDELVALFIPGFAGPDHAANAVEAARDLLVRTGHEEGAPWLPVGAGVHVGSAYIGTVGEDEALDFTALGDPVNTAARLAGVAKAGEILVSGTAAAAAGLDTDGLETRSLDLRGRSEALEAVMLSVTGHGAQSAPR
jgi:adenylate cyclase